VVVEDEGGEVGEVGSDLENQNGTRMRTALLWLHARQLGGKD
jgi:hypothetical protein